MLSPIGTYNLYLGIRKVSDVYSASTPFETSLVRLLSLTTPVVLHQEIQPKVTVTYREGGFVYQGRN